MGQTIPCFLLEPTNRGRRALRRYSTKAGPCPAHGLHDAEQPIDEADLEGVGPGGEYRGYFEAAADDPRYPAACSCGYVFDDDDARQANVSRLYRRSDTGAMVTLGEAPVGAMWFADWYPSSFDSPKHAERGGGPHLILKTPGGDWDIDAISSNGSGWMRTGTAPAIVASPSILCENGRAKYHGFLGGPSGNQPGVLVEC